MVEISNQEVDILMRAMGTYTLPSQAVQFHNFCEKNGHPLTFTADEVLFFKEEDEENSEALFYELLEKWANQ